MTTLLLNLPFLFPAPPLPPPPEVFLAALGATLESLSASPRPIEVQRRVLPVDLEHHADADGVFAYPLPERVLEELGRRRLSSCDPCSVEGPGPRWTRVTFYGTDAPSRGLWELYVRTFERMPAESGLVRYSEGVTVKFWVECAEGGGCRVLRSETVML